MRTRVYSSAWPIILLLIVGIESFPAWAQQVPPVYWRAAEAMGAGDYPTARRLFSTMLTGKDFYFNAYWRLAECYALEKKFGKGQTFFENLLKHDAPAGEVYSALAFLAELRGDRKQTVEYCWQAVQNYTQFLAIHQKLIDLAPAYGLEQQVRPYLENRLAKNPGDWVAKFTMAYWETSRERPEVSAEKFARLIADGHKNWRIYFRWALQLMLMSKLDSAQVAVDLGLLASQQINDRDGEGQLLNLKGYIYMRQGRLHKADSLLTRVKQLSVAIGYLKLQVELAGTLSGIRLQQGRLQEALVHAKLSGELAEKLNYEYGEMQACHYAADVYRRLGLYEKAIQMWTQAYKMADSLESQSNRQLMAHNLALVYQVLGEYQRAQLYFDEVVTYGRTYQQQFFLASYLNSLASSLAGQQRWHEAQAYYEEALTLAQKSDLVDLQCNIMLNQSSLAQKTGDWVVAEKAAVAALRLARRAQLKPSIQSALVQLAETELHQLQLVKAKQHFDEAKQLSAETQVYHSIIESSNGLGRVALAQGDYQRAVNILDEGARLIARRVFSEHIGTASPFLAFEKELFFSLSRAYVHLQQPALALEVAEKMRDLIVRRRLQRASLLSHIGMVDSLRWQGTKFDSLLLEKRLQLTSLTELDSTAVDKKTKLLVQIADLELQQTRLWEKIGIAPQDRAKDHFSSALNFYQKELKNQEEMALVYLVGNEGLLIFAVEGDSLRGYDLPISKPALQALVCQVNPALKYALQESQQLQLISPLFFRYEPPAASKIYNLLLARQVENTTCKKLLVIPDEHLNFLPFELLLQTANADTVSKDYRNLGFMLKNYAFRYASSLQAAFKVSSEHEQIPATVLAIGPAVSDGNNDSVDAQDILQTQRETEAIQQTLGSSAVKIMNEVLTPARKWQNELMPYAVLHFAAHSEAQNADPLSSRIILAEGLAETNSLYAFEIFAMNLPKGRLAFLSSCNTASGVLRDSEGLQGFVQAFRAAGIPSVIGSLWPADAETSAKLAEQFYSHLRAGASAAEALRQAKLFLLEGEKANPFFWAAFQYYGVDQAIRFQQSINVKPFLAIISLALLIGAMRALQGRLQQRSSS